jgi:hypothetical protein
MSDRKDGGPAFPTDMQRYQGMTLRDYFATKAMAAMIATSAEPWCTGYEQRTAENAYAMADALLSEREGGGV